MPLVKVYPIPFPKTSAQSPERERKKPFANSDFALAAPGKIHNPARVMHRYLPLGLIIGLLIAFRILGSVLPESQPNFQPLAALFFCGALLAPGWRGFAIPFGIWAVTYPFGIGPVSDVPIFLTTLLALVATFLIGKSISERGIPILLLGSIAAAVVFHLITNGIAWFGDPMYEKSLIGLWQSLWTGPPGSPLPSWIFLRNLAAANFLFTAIFAGAQLRLPRLAPPAPLSVSAK
jgi:hypothetical protein